MAWNTSVRTFGAKLRNTVSIHNSDKLVMQKFKNYLIEELMIAVEYSIGVSGSDFNVGYGVKANKDETLTGLVEKGVKKLIK